MVTSCIIMDGTMVFNFVVSSIINNMPPEDGGIGEFTGSARAMYRDALGEYGLLTLLHRYTKTELTFLLGLISRDEKLCACTCFGKPNLASQKLETSVDYQRVHNFRFHSFKIQG